MSKRKKKKYGWQGQVFLILCLFACIIFSSMAIILAIGMIPTFVAFVADKTRGRMRALSIGAINFAGCMPFLIEVFKKGNSLEVALSYVMQPRTIVAIYFAAAMGYLIVWAMTGIVSSVMVQRAKGRLKDIQKLQKDLISRWGPEVAGTIPLDEHGFPVERGAPKEEQA